MTRSDILAAINAAERGSFTEVGRVLRELLDATGEATAVTVTATTGALPAADGAQVIANTATPTVVELLAFCVELNAKLAAIEAKLT